MFSRASLLTVKALRNYHRSGLLVPAEVDPETGYRAYHIGQLADAQVIRKLRQLEVSLDDIAVIMAERDSAVTSKVLTQHLAIMEDRLAETRNIVDELLRGNEQPAVLTPPSVIEVEHAYVASLSGIVERHGYAEFLDSAFQTIFGALAQIGVAPVGPAGACYPPEVQEPEEVMAFVPVAGPFEPPARSSVAITELPARRVASLAHRGSYDDIGDAYLAIGQWVALNSEPLDEPVREHYVISYSETDDPANFVTEVHWPVHERNPS